MMVLATVFSIIVIPIVRKFAPALGLIDKPDHRKVHTSPIPRVGGWGLAMGSMIPILLLLPFDNFILSYLISATILFILGAWDDSHESGHYFKFAGQIIVAGIVVFYGGVWIHHLPFFGMDEIPSIIGQLFSIFAIVGMINATNHSDGLDGLAGGESLLSLLVIAYLAFVADGITTVLVACAAIGGLFGFLRYNTHPAEIFMGDTGSGFLGFTLAVLAIYLTQHDHTALSPAIVLLFLGLPIIDLFGVLYLRISGGMNWFRATRNHIHHRLLDLGFDHYETVIIIYSIQALLVISAIFLRYHSDYLIVSVYVFTAVALFSCLSFAEKQGWQYNRRPSSSLTSTVSFFIDNRTKFIQASLKFVSLLVPLFFVISSILSTFIPRDFGLTSALLATLMLASIFTGSCSGIVFRAGVYICAIFTVYLLEKSQLSNIFLYIDNLSYALLTIAIAIIVRYETENKFQTSPMDYLIVFGVLVAAVFAGRYSTVQDTGILIVKCMILLYASELLYVRMKSKFSLLKIATVASLCILAYRGFA